MQDLLKSWLKEIWCFPNQEMLSTALTTTVFGKKTSNNIVEIPCIVSSELSYYDISVIVNALSTFHSQPCICFVTRSTQTDYITIENKDGWEQSYLLDSVLQHNFKSYRYCLTSLISLLPSATLLLAELVASRWCPSKEWPVWHCSEWAPSCLGLLPRANYERSWPVCQDQLGERLLKWPTTYRNKTPATKTLYMTTAPSCTMEEQPSPSSLGWKPSLPFLMGQWKLDRGKECLTSWGSTSWMDAKDEE